MFFIQRDRFLQTALHRNIKGIVGFNAFFFLFAVSISDKKFFLMMVPFGKKLRIPSSSWITFCFTWEYHPVSLVGAEQRQEILKWEKGEKPRGRIWSEEVSKEKRVWMMRDEWKSGRIASWAASPSYHVCCLGFPMFYQTWEKQIILFYLQIYLRKFTNIANFIFHYLESL